MEKLKQAIEANTLDGQNGVWVHPTDMWNETVERSGKTYRRFCHLDRIERKNTSSCLMKPLHRVTLKSSALWTPATPPAEWREDYEANERGEIPPDLTRGVLSQDALFDL